MNHVTINSFDMLAAKAINQNITFSCASYDYLIYGQDRAYYLFYLFEFNLLINECRLLVIFFSRLPCSPCFSVSLDVLAGTSLRATIDTANAADVMIAASTSTANAICHETHFQTSSFNAIVVVMSRLTVMMRTSADAWNGNITEEEPRKVLPQHSPYRSS